MNTYLLLVKGRVQGVWFRKYTIKYAKELDIYGYVQNQENKSVKIVANIDTQEKLEKFIEKLYEGSPFSFVEDITCKQVENQDFWEFEQR